MAFDMCIKTPSSSLTSAQKNCISNFVDRFGDV